MKTITRVPGTFFAIIVLGSSLGVTPVVTSVFAPPSVVITVDTPLDEFLATGGTGCSLREAIYSLNHADYGGCTRLGMTGRFTVRVPAGTYSLTLHGSGEDDAQSGDLDILTGMDIIGDGIATTIVDGDASDRVFDVLAGNTAIVTLNDLAIYNGDSGVDLGGGILNNSQLTLTRVRLDHNACDSSGGAIFHKSFPTTGAILTLNNSQIMSNTAAGLAGGVWVDIGSGLVADHTTISFNHATECGGIYIDSMGEVIMDYVRFTNNSAYYFSGGLCTTNGTDQNVVIRDSEFAGNSAGSFGGNILTDGKGNLTLIRSEVTLGSATVGAGIYSASISSFAYMVLENVTVSQNTASTQGGGIQVNDGFVDAQYVTIADNISPIGAGLSSSGNFQITGAIIARNVTPTGELANCAGGEMGFITSLGYNITDGSACAILADTDLIHTDPLLGTYGLHGSINDTGSYALRLGSPAIDVANPGYYPSVDQRGIPRPFPLGGAPDIGAHESSFSYWFLPIISH